MDDDEAAFDRKTAWACADDCDTCWFLLSDEAEETWGDPEVNRKLRRHLASGHMLNSSES